MVSDLQGVNFWGDEDYTMMIGECHVRINGMGIILLLSKIINYYILGSHVNLCHVCTQLHQVIHHVHPVQGPAAEKDQTTDRAWVRGLRQDHSLVSSGKS